MLDRVTDPKNHSPSVGAKEAKKAEDLLHREAAAFGQHLNDLIDAAMDFGWAKGWDAGFEAGWEGAFESLKEKEIELRTAARTEKPPARRPASSAQLSLMNLPMSRNLTAAEMVLVFIREYPGARGVDIANHFAEISPPIPERTVRTALHRLKKAKEIKIIDGKWYGANVDVRMT